MGRWLLVEAGFRGLDPREGTASPLCLTLFRSVEISFRGLDPREGTARKTLHEAYEPLHGVSEVSTRERVLQALCEPMTIQEKLSFRGLDPREGTASCTRLAPTSTTEKFQRSRPERGYCKSNQHFLRVAHLLFQRSRPERGYCKLQALWCPPSFKRFQRSRPERGYCKLAHQGHPHQNRMQFQRSRPERGSCKIASAAGVHLTDVEFQRSRPERGYCKATGGDIRMVHLLVSEVSTRERVLQVLRILHDSCSHPGFRGLDPREGTASSQQQCQQHSSQEFQRSRPERGYCKRPELFVSAPPLLSFRGLDPREGPASTTVSSFTSAICCVSEVSTRERVLQVRRIVCALRLRTLFQRSRPERGYCKYRLYGVRHHSKGVSEVSTRERVLQDTSAAPSTPMARLFQRSRPERGYCKVQERHRVRS